MKKYEDLIREAQKSRSFNLREFLTRSEGPELFTTVLNDKLFNALQPELPVSIASVYEEVPLDAGRTLRFPSIRGININMVPENSEFQRADWEITGVEVEPVKFGILLGLTREMIEHSQLSMIGRAAATIGAAHRDLYRRELLKCLSFFSTGASKATGVIGNENHGGFYAAPAGGYTNFISASALGYENMIGLAMTMLNNQRVTITAKGIDVPFPVTPDTIVANPHHKIQIQKVLNAGIVVVAAGSLGTTNLAGQNILNGILPNQIFDSEIPTGQILIGKAKAGTVVIRQSTLKIDEIENYYFDAHDTRSKEEYLPAVIEDRFWCDIQST